METNGFRKGTKKKPLEGKTKIPEIIMTSAGGIHPFER